MQTRPSLDIDGGSAPVLIPEGEYGFQVSGAKACISKAGNDQIELSLSVYNVVNRTYHYVYTYLVDKDNMEWKTRHFCKSTGLEEVYATGTLAPLDCLHAKGICHIVHEKSKDYPTKAAVKDFLFDQSEVKAESQAATVPPGDDDIPF